MRSQKIGILNLGVILALLFFSAGPSSLQAEEVGAIAASQQDIKMTGSSTFGEGLPNTSSRFNPHSRSVDVFACVLVWSAKESGTEAWA
ncbi:MAG: hypothetical protein JSR39_09105, partial [Verrucomicrobia bacterium]|nr:hypothetical protein [Verrucomicrobiota bacterium]